ncbi:helix-turn-helix transcriptional regulator [Phytohabitans houttuyneae]|uniref:Helix-turn-helix domain-containing protein n=1 Tax=Phytohabitans houttuyneae TaxID=1076126 RepID=A0A6V8KCY1_9ACTN|nr:helix-turn-helix domain-containing protein [Phytohabitans houttuyneae]GFJ79547.1 hypothetical protein Phou_037270 [Phytohabitans houttuyneae]
MLLSVEEVMGAAEIADLLGVSRQRVQQLVSRPDFPPPATTLAMGKIWLASDVRAWVREHRPELADQETPSAAPPLGRRHGSRTSRMPKGKDSRPPRRRPKDD